MTFASVALSEHLGAYAVVGPKIVGAGGPDLGIHERDVAQCEDPDSSGDAVAAQHVRLGSRVESRAQHAAQCLGYLPYLIQISTIIFSYWVQVKTLKKAPPSMRNTVENFLETEKVVGYDTRVPKLLTHVALNYSLYWAGMGATLVAGQSFSMWTHDDQGKWVKAWSQVPAVGDVTGVLFGWLSVPVILTIYAVINYGILVMQYLCVNSDPENMHMQFADLANLPLFSAFLKKRDGEDTHLLRHLRMCLIAGPHIWVKTSLLAMSWQSSSRFEKANIMVPLFLTMGSKVYSQVQVYKNATCAEIQRDICNGTTGVRVFMLFLSVLNICSSQRVSSSSSASSPAPPRIS